MLDSGAFTYFSADSQTVDWDKYIEEYAEFINNNHVNLFLELDIDRIIGYESVKKLRAKLERLTGKKCIPVWHKNRGKNEFLKMCDEYNYVAIGGIVSKEITRSEYQYLSFFINAAHKKGAKIHGLGFTLLDDIKKYHFDSGDSTLWNFGSRYGYADKFIGNRMKKIKRPDGTRAITSDLQAHNFLEWSKYANWAQTHI